MYKAVNQLIKGYKLVMHSSMILAAKNKALQSANEKVKRQRSLKKKYIHKRGTISAIEV